MVVMLQSLFIDNGVFFLEGICDGCGKTTVVQFWVLSEVSATNKNHFFAVYFCRNIYYFCTNLT